MKNIISRRFIDSMRFPATHKLALRDYLRAFDSNVEGSGIREIWLFGSCARESATVYSDVDLLVLVEGSSIEDFKHAKARVMHIVTFLSEDPEVQITIRFADTFWSGTDRFTKNVKTDAVIVAKYE